MVGKALPPIEEAPGIEDGEGNQKEVEGGGEQSIYFLSSGHNLRSDFRIKPFSRLKTTFRKY